MLFGGQPPQWMVLGIAASRLRWSLKIGLTTLGLDESVEILRTRHRDEKLRTGNIVAADRSWFFTLCFNATGTELLACSGVKNERPSRGDGQKLQLERPPPVFAADGTCLPEPNRPPPLSPPAASPSGVRGGQCPARPQGDHRRSYRRRPQTGGEVSINRSVHGQMGRDSAGPSPRSLLVSNKGVQRSPRTDMCEGSCRECCRVFGSGC